MDAGEQKALDDIAKHGCHIINLLAEGELPEFSYSVGIQQQDTTCPQLSGAVQ